MVEILIPGLYLSAGIMAYATIQHLSIARQPPYDLTQLLFGGMCMVAVLFAIFQAKMLQSFDIAEFIVVLKIILTFGLLFYVLFIWFISLHTGSRPRYLLEGLSLFLIR